MLLVMLYHSYLKYGLSTFTIGIPTVKVEFYLKLFRWFITINWKFCGKHFVAVSIHSLLCHEVKQSLLPPSPHTNLLYLGTWYI